MNERHTLIAYTLETVPRPGARETRVRRPPQGALIRNGRERTDGQQG